MHRRAVPVGWEGKCCNIRRSKSLSIEFEEIPIKNGRFSNEILEFKRGAVEPIQGS